ncbi:hypothetical protein HPP92_017751 [Vanilla planifolia]|uniref:DUF676 domain-containing protein n=1 Tax=Vanilla planifolia TaxID=51239 RepID=A0A835QGP7_VANPL|nr:hypothetical protein HPP92_017751 [Vanilla planifolia]
MLAAGTPSALSVGITDSHWIRCPGGMSCLGFRPRARSSSVSGGMAGWMNCARDPMKSMEKKKVVVETVPGGENLWAEGIQGSKLRKGFPEHLVIMVNGLIGSAEDWRFAAEQFVTKLPDKVIVHRSACNSSILTFDGVDLMGERTTKKKGNMLVDHKKVISVVNKSVGVQKISFVAHSLGGLIARYAIGRLYEPSISRDSSSPTVNCSKDENRLGKIAGLEALNFITFASPHLGSRGPKQVGCYYPKIMLPICNVYTKLCFLFLCGLPFLERRASAAAHLIVGRTGKHLFLTDNDDGRPPLLLRMVDDCDDIKFFIIFLYQMINIHIVWVDKRNKGSTDGEVLSDVEGQKYDLEDVLKSVKQRHIENRRLLGGFHGGAIKDNWTQIFGIWLDSFK